MAITLYVYPPANLPQYPMPQNRFGIKELETAQIKAFRVEAWLDS